MLTYLESLGVWIAIEQGVVAERGRVGAGLGGLPLALALRSDVGFLGPYQEISGKVLT